jgi:transposase
MDVSGIEALLGLPAFRVVNQVLLPKRVELHRQRRETSRVCPRCQTCCFRVQDRRPRGIRDVPILERPVVLWLHLRRFAGQECHHRPGEKRETLGARVQWTERLYQPVRAEFLGGCPSHKLARRSGVSERPVFRWTCERSRGGRPRPLSRAIEIDAYARGKGHRDTTSRIDLDTGRPIATLKGRRAEEVIAWFTSRPPAERDRVDVVGVAMSKTYASALQQLLGESGHVIERFPVGQRAVDALDEVWRSVQKPRDPEDAQALKQLRCRWLKSANQRKVDALVGRYEWRRRFPPLREMIDWVQGWRMWFERTDEKPAREALLQLIERASQSVHEPLKRMAGT